MKFTLFYQALIVGATILLAVSGSIAQAEADYEQRLKELATTIDKLQQELTQTRSSRDQLQQTLQNSEQEISDLIKKVELIKEALAREKKQLNQLRSRQTELEQVKRQQQRQISEVVRWAYLLGQQSQIKLLLNQETPYRISRLLRYHDYIVAAHKTRVDTYLRTLRDIDAITADLLTSAARLEDKRRQLDQRFQELKGVQAKRLATLVTLNRELLAKGSALSQLQTDQQRLERLLAEATQALSSLRLPGDARLFRQVKGQLPFPVRGRIVHDYGSPRLKGKLRWQGLFIQGDTGSPVASVHYGRVIFSDYLRGYGLLLIIDHGDGYMSLYAHNQTLLKEVGDWVSGGETIATLGNTGGQNRAGLYFEIRHNGKPRNPRPWLN